AGADAGEAHRVVAVVRDGARRPGRVEVGIQLAAGDVGGPELLGDVKERAPVRGPHGRGVLPVEVGDPAVEAAVGGGDPDVVVGRAAVALAVPQARAGDVGEHAPEPGARSAGRGTTRL